MKRELLTGLTYLALWQLLGFGVWLGYLYWPRRIETRNDTQNHKELWVTGLRVSEVDYGNGWKCITSTDDSMLSVSKVYFLTNQDGFTITFSKNPSEQWRWEYSCRKVKP